MKRPLIVLVLISTSILVFFILNLVLGTISIPVGSVWNILFGIKEESIIWENIIWKSRFPQTITALVAGAGLSISGLQMQTLFRNPLAGPSELGISSGASLGVAFIILLSGSVGGTALIKMGLFGEIAISIAAVAGALAIMIIIITISRFVRGNVILLIIGVMIGYIATAIIGVLKFFSNDDDVRAYVIWGLGSFSKVSGNQVYTFVGIMIVLIPLSFLLIKLSI
jgi:ABC-type cobalamin transport system, permease component